MKYLVKRRHYGDKFYEEGDTREASEASVAHLVPDTLEPIKEKAAPTPKNKSQSAPKNKAK